MTVDEELPWGRSRLIVGTGIYGSLPITPKVIEEAGRRGMDVIAIRTEDACRQIAGVGRREIHAVLHVTC